VLSIGIYYQNFIILKVVINYINGVHELISDDHRHAEYYVLFHDKEFYELWYELFNNRYVAVKEELFYPVQRKEFDSDRIFRRSYSEWSKTRHSTTFKV